MKIFILFFIFVNFVSPTSSVLKNINSPEKEKQYKLVWSDEFNYKGKPNPKKWGYEHGFVRNFESQYYTDRKKNARVENGNLIIESRVEKFRNKAYTSKNDRRWRAKKKFAQYTSASLTTKDFAKWKYAKIDVRAKLPKGIGTWSAIWLLGDNKTGYGEIDIMENVGYSPNIIHGTIHSRTDKSKKIIEKSKEIKINKPSEKYRVYSVEWDAQKIDFMVDGKLYHRVTKNNKNADLWTFDQSFHLKINNAIGGKWGGRKGIDNDSFPLKMYVDYVRVFQIETDSLN